MPTFLRPALLVTALCVGAGLAPRPAAAQAAPLVASPQVQALEVRADAGLTPGSGLDFTLRGTPGGKARVQVAGTPINAALRETEPGVYTGHAAVPRGGPLAPDTVIRSMLAVGPRTVISNHRFPIALLSPQQQEAIAANAPLKPLQPQQVLRIERFTAEPVDSLLPGTELRFALEGPPGARASFELPNVASNLPMTEQSPGHYVGHYTLRRQDAMGAGAVVATLHSDGRTVSVPLEGPLVASAGGSAQMGAAPTVPLTLQVTTPGANGSIGANGALVQGRTAPGASVHVLVGLVPPHAPGSAAVARTVAEQTVLADAQGHFSFSLGPQQVPEGTRFDVLMRASQAGQSTPEQRLVLYQRG